jgi:hypothetical protein
VSVPIKVFCGYAHEDKNLLEKLKISLEPFRREGSISLWADSDITAGIDWEEEIHKQLNDAQVILFLVSPDFIASNYCYSVEMKRALEWHERGEARVIPIILRHTYWQNTPINKLQALPTNARPVIDSCWISQDEAFLDIATGIGKVICELREKQVSVFPIDDKVSHNSTYVGDLTTRNTAKESQLVKGANDFIASLDSVSEKAKMFLQQLCDWAVSLEQKHLVQLYTYHGKGEILTLLPRLKLGDAGLVSIYNNHGTAYIQFWRSVFERRAPVSLAHIEASIMLIKQGNTCYEVSEELLAMLTEAYREAVGHTRSIS